MAANYPVLAVDEGLFLQGTEALVFLESAGKKFELLNAVTEFSNSARVAKRFAEVAEREIGTEEKSAIDYYIAAVYLVHHHRADVEDLIELLDEFVEPVADFIRTAAWAFLAAWNLRYGGLLSYLVSGGTLVDPNLPAKYRSVQS